MKGWIGIGLYVFLDVCNWVSYLFVNWLFPVSSCCTVMFKTACRSILRRRRSGWSSFCALLACSGMYQFPRPRCVYLLTRRLGDRCSCGRPKDMDKFGTRCHSHRWCLYSAVTVVVLKQAENSPVHRVLSTPDVCEIEMSTVMCTCKILFVAERDLYETLMYAMT